MRLLDHVGGVRGGGGALRVTVAMAKAAAAICVRAGKVRDRQGRRVLLSGQE